MQDSLKIAVLVSVARHPVSGRPMRSAADAAALELACTLASPASLTVVHAGICEADELRDYLGLGAPAVELMKLSAGQDAVAVLAARLAGYDIVICGNRADGQDASGLFPYLLAERMRMPLVSDVLEATLQDRRLTLRQFLPKGLRRRLQAQTPVVLAVHPRAPQTRQFAYARAVAGRITEGRANGLFATSAVPVWQSEAITRRPRPLQAKVVQSGHSRMLGAIGDSSGGRAGEVVKQGNAVEKAQVLLAYLREHRLIDF
jgi:electron transfer flavoprotein beta subunit